MLRVQNLLLAIFACSKIIGSTNLFRILSALTTEFMQALEESIARQEELLAFIEKKKKKKKLVS